MRPQKTHEPTEFEQQLQSLTVIETSDEYLGKGMDLLNESKPKPFFRWQPFATGGLVLALVVSLGLNVIQFNSSPSENPAADVVTPLDNADLMANQFTGEKHVVLSPPTDSQSEQRFALGEDFNLIDASALSPGDGRLLISNFFWYGCNYCIDFNNLINPWQNKQRAENDITYQRIPAVWSDLMLFHARAYYAAMEFPNAEAIHQSLFNAIHGNRDAYTNEQAIAYLFTDNGVTYNDFISAINAPRTLLLAERARELTNELRPAGLTGVPGLIVNRRYLVKNTRFEQMLNVADYLLQLEQAGYKEGVEGTVVIEFDVNTDGSVSSVELRQPVKKLRLLKKGLKERKQQNDRADDIF